MLLTIYYFLPVITCLLWVLIHLLIASKTDTFRVFIALFLACGLYIFSEACHALSEHGSTLYVVSTLIGMLAGPSIVPLLIRYLHRLMHNARSDSPLGAIWLIIPAALFSGGTILYILRFEPLATDKVHKMFHLITEDIYNVVLAAELIYLLIFVAMILRQKRLIPGTFFSFLFKGKRIGLSRLQLGVGMIPMVVMAARIGFGNNLYSQSTTVAVISATLLFLSAFFFGFNALLGNHPIVRMKDFGSLNSFNYNSAKRIEAPESPVQSTSSPTEDDALSAGFKRLMDDKKLFLQPNLTLEDVADILHSNKTYVSRMVNNSYGQGFSELMNRMRVDYAKEYILSHRSARQSEIARNCGFLSASSFNTIFKKVTGTTPKIWFASADNK